MTPAAKNKDALADLRQQFAEAEQLASPPDLQVTANELHPRIDPLSAPTQLRAITMLCDELTGTTAVYHGTDPILVFPINTSR